MRIIRFIFSSLVFIVFLLVVGIFLGRELLMLLATNDLQRAANLLMNNQNHLSNCYDGFSRSPSAWGQLRFINEREYQLETVCSDFAKRPILIETKTLPIFVKKVDGGSGFVFDLQNKRASQIVLNALGKETTVFKEINELTVGKAPTMIDYTSGPASECAGFNYQCCQNDTEQGIGKKQDSATDCPKTCYQGCQPRPIVLAFNAMPSNANDKRMVSIASGQTVAFAYVVGDGKQQLFSNQTVLDEQDNSFLHWKSHLQVFVDLLSNIEKKSAETVQLPISSTIFFGDGQSFSTQDLQGVVDHVYTCGEGVCYFEAWIEAKDARLTPSVDYELSRLKIIVSN